MIESSVSSTFARIVLLLAMLAGAAMPASADTRQHRQWEAELKPLDEALVTYGELEVRYLQSGLLDDKIQADSQAILIADAILLMGEDEGLYEFALNKLNRVAQLSSRQGDLDQAVLANLEWTIERSWEEKYLLRYLQNSKTKSHLYDELADAGLLMASGFAFKPLMAADLVAHFGRISALALDLSAIGAGTGAVVAEATSRHDAGKAIIPPPPARFLTFSISDEKAEHERVESLKVAKRAFLTGVSAFSGMATFSACAKVIAQGTADALNATAWVGKLVEFGVCGSLAWAVSEGAHELTDRAIETAWSQSKASAVKSAIAALEQGKDPAADSRKLLGAALEYAALKSFPVVTLSIDEKIELSTLSGNPAQAARREQDYARRMGKALNAAGMTVGTMSAQKLARVFLSQIDSPAHARELEAALPSALIPFVEHYRDQASRFGVDFSSYLAAQEGYDRDYLLSQIKQRPLETHLDDLFLGIATLMRARGGKAAELFAAQAEDHALTFAKFEAQAFQSAGGSR